MNEALKIQKNYSQFGVYIQAGYTLVKATEELDPESYDALLQEIDTVESSHFQHYLFDFGKLDQLNELWGQLILKVMAMVKETSGDRTVRIINANTKLLASMKALGLAEKIPVSSNLDVAHYDIGLSKGVFLDVNILVPFINATAHAIETITHTKSMKLAAFKQIGTAPLQGDISAAIPVTGPTFNGVFMLSFLKETICGLVERLTGEQQKKMSSLVQSAVGEFVNIAATNAKKTLNEVGYGLQYNVPTVIADSIFPEAFELPNQKSIVVPFETDVGKYYIDVRYLEDESGKSNLAE